MKWNKWLILRENNNHIGKAISISTDASNTQMYDDEYEEQPDIAEVIKYHTGHWYILAKDPLRTAVLKLVQNMMAGKEFVLQYSGSYMSMHDAYMDWRCYLPIPDEQTLNKLLEYKKTLQPSLYIFDYKDLGNDYDIHTSDEWRGVKHMPFTDINGVIKQVIQLFPALKPPRQGARKVMTPKERFGYKPGKASVVLPGESKEDYWKRIASLPSDDTRNHPSGRPWDGD